MNMGTYLVSIIFFCAIIICNSSLSKRNYLPNLNSIDTGSSKLNECQRCKMLTDSFNYWLEKTSRGKFEGGDAAWEESKLKSYARSEIRLVEIQEGLCSELKKHQDKCYSLAEEAEQVIEKWWFQDDPNSADMYTWLCTETLQYCCPQNHFGESCSPCPITNNEVCSGQGRCDGDGTREGNGSCICKRGFTGQFCEDCAKNYYRTNFGCDPCHKSCNGCSGEGAASCNVCAKGWELNNGLCVDINECIDPSICKYNQYCINKEGSHLCKTCAKSCKTCMGEGPSNCTSCHEDSKLWSGTCVDENIRAQLWVSAQTKIALYTGLLLIAYFALRKSKVLGFFIILAVAVFIGVSENTSDMTRLYVFGNMYI